MALVDLIIEKQIKTPLKSQNKKDVLHELVQILVDSGSITDEKGILKAVLDREEISSTGLGQGIAIPHAKTPLVERIVVALGISPKGIEFEALDDELSNLFFLIIAPSDQAGVHLQTLSEIGGVTRDSAFIESLITASSSSEIVKIFNN